MPSATRICRHALAGMWIILVFWAWAFGPLSPLAGADQAGTPSSVPPAKASDSHPWPSRDVLRRGASEGQGRSGSWWLGTAGVAVVLAVIGGIGVATRRQLPGLASGPLRVVGRTSLSPKHTVYLLRAGSRVLIVGAGPQGAPSLLGELSDPEDLAAFAPPGRRASTVTTSSFDRRVGDDE